MALNNSAHAPTWGNAGYITGWTGGAICPLQSLTVSNTSSGEHVHSTVSGTIIYNMNGTLASHTALFKDNGSTVIPVNFKDVPQSMINPGPYNITQFIYRPGIYGLPDQYWCASAPIGANGTDNWINSTNDSDLYSLHQGAYEVNNDPAFPDGHFTFQPGDSLIFTIVPSKPNSGANASVPFWLSTNITLKEDDTAKPKTKNAARGGSRALSGTCVFMLAGMGLAMLL